MSLAFPLIPLIFIAVNIYFAYRSFKAKQWFWVGLSCAFASIAAYDVVLQLFL